MSATIQSKVPDRLLTMVDAADLLNLSYNTIRNLVAADEIPHVRIRSRTVRFLRSSLIEMLRAAERGNAGTGGGA